MSEPLRGEIWLVDLNPTRGREPFGRRPALIVSVDLFNRGPAGLVVTLPITSKEKGIPFHLKIEAHESGLSKKSFIQCEDIRSIAKERILKRVGQISPGTLTAVADCLRILLNL